MKPLINNIIFSISIVILTLHISCNLAKPISTLTINENLIARYHLFYNNRTSKHKYFGFYVSIYSNNSKINNNDYYIFYLNSNKVEKIKNYNGIKSNYILNINSTKNICNENLIPLTPIELVVFDKIIYYSDSLKLKDFNFLKMAKGYNKSTNDLILQDCQ